LSTGNRLLEAFVRLFFDALQIPEATLWIRLCERKEENFLIPPGRSDDAVLIEVSLIAGRSAEKKEALYRAIVEQLARDPGVSPDDVCIVVYEPPAENWAERAGISAARR